MSPDRVRWLLVVALTVLAAAGCGEDDDPRPSPAPVTAESSSIAPGSAPPSSPASGQLYDDELRGSVPNQPSPFAVGYYGDSLAHSAQEHVEEFLDAGLRIRFVDRTFPGSALCDWFDSIDEDRAAEGFWAVILLFSNNTFTECMADDDGAPLDPDAAFEKFAADLEAAVAAFRSDGVRVYLPTLPITRSDVLDGIDSVVRYNDLFADLAAGDDGVAVVDAAAAVLGPDGEYVEALPCLPIEPCVGGVDENGTPVNLVREPDGAHFCTGGFGTGVDIVPGNCPGWSSGAFRYAGALTAPIIEDGYAEWAARPESQDPQPSDPTAG